MPLKGKYIYMIVSIAENLVLKDIEGISICLFETINVMNTQVKIVLGLNDVRILLLKSEMTIK